MIDGWLALIVTGSMLVGWLVGMAQVMRDWNESDQDKDRQIRALRRAVEYTRRTNA
jgi:hypothetical protein